MTDEPTVPAAKSSSSLRLPRQYDPGLLQALSRRPRPRSSRLAGRDYWRAWELSWRQADALPCAAVARFAIPASSPRLIESRSMKLYLFSLADRVFENRDALCETLRRDIGRAVGAPIEAELAAAEAAELQPQACSGVCLDQLTGAVAPQRGGEVAVPPKWQLGAAAESPQPQLLGPATAEHSNSPVFEELHSHLFRSLCPATGQPDFATVHIAYRGPRMDREALLGYLLSYRLHRDFHEHCIEQIWSDISARCRPQQLSVCGSFLRRGGIDISPVRRSPDMPELPPPRGFRQ